MMAQELRRLKKGKQSSSHRKTNLQPMQKSSGENSTEEGASGIRVKRKAGAR